MNPNNQIGSGNPDASAERAQATPQERSAIEHHQSASVSQSLEEKPLAVMQAMNAIQHRFMYGLDGDGVEHKPPTLRDDTALIESLILAVSAPLKARIEELEAKVDGAALLPVDPSAEVQTEPLPCCPGCGNSGLDSSHSWCSVCGGDSAAAAQTLRNAFIAGAKSPVQVGSLWLYRVGSHHLKIHDAADAYVSGLHGTPEAILPPPYADEKLEAAHRALLATGADRQLIAAFEMAVREDES